MAKITTNIRFKLNIVSNKFHTLSQNDKMLESYFRSKGKLNIISRGEKYVLTSYRFSNSEAEIKFRINYNLQGYMQSIDMLGTFDCLKRYIGNCIFEYKRMVDGFVVYLEQLYQACCVDEFVFRIIPIDFKKQFLSRVGESVQDIYVSLVIDFGTCTILNDRLEINVIKWDESIVDIVTNILSKYTRK